MSGDEMRARLAGLCERYCRGEMTAEDYFAAVDEYAEEMVEAEVADERRRRRAR